MRRVPNAVLAALRQRQTVIAYPMVWIEARDRSNGAARGIGMWRGEANQKIAVTDLFTGRGAARDFYTGALLAIDGVIFETGLNVRPITLRLSALHPAVLTAFREHDGRGAPVQVWRRYYDPITMRPLAPPVGWFMGWVNAAPSERPAPGGEPMLDVQVVGPQRELTITSGLKKSHEAQKRRLGDEFRKYKGEASTWRVPWGVDG